MIRLLDPCEDRAAVERLFARAADYVALERGPTDPSDSAADVFEGALPPGVEADRSLVLGLEGPAALDGLAQVVFGYPRPADAYIGLLLLVPDARGRGVGRRVLRDLEERARIQGADRLLVAVLDANPRGRSFWEREGFREEERFEDRAYGTLSHGVARLARRIPAAGEEGAE